MRPRRIVYVRVAECALGEEMSSKDWHSDGCGHDSRTADCFKGNVCRRHTKVLEQFVVPRKVLREP